MRTKTLLTAIAALAAGIAINSSAQVYSANVVGYANVATPNASSYYMMACPFTIGASNGVNEVFGSLPDFSEILLWDNGSQTLQGYIYDSTQGNGIDWYLDDDATPANPLPTLPPGKGFFLIPGGGLVTNTFSGAVAVNVGTTNNMSLANASSYYLLGSPVPFSGYITNQIALTNLPDFTEVLKWDTDNQSLKGFIYDTTQGNGINWYLDDDATPADCPTLGVGEGFYIIPGGSYTWQQSLSVN